MFKKIQPLSSDAHQDLRFSRINSFDFARTVLTAPLTASEFFMAAQVFPIVFPSEGTAPLSLFALNQKTNCYVANEGAWTGSYVPAHIRRYPFILANNDQNDAEDNFVVCIDTDAPHFAAGEGDPMFTADGKPADVTQNAIKFLQQFQKELNITQEICQDLESQQVLIERKIAIEKDGQKNIIGGFRCVDMEKINALEDAVLAKWVRNGLMGIITTHLQSLGNLQSLS